ncbi:response regulator [Natrialba sp. PRR66]|uniref:response regulator n=1 Tax=Natrialba sp. PRR66 TaxID=3098146 RepID=UPI002B1E1459|nr:response regulator [Natrialba sp. PRR66]
MRTDRPQAYPLVIDSNVDDARLFLDALENKTTANGVSIVSSGTEALDFLRRCVEEPDCVRPNLVVLDIDLPGMDWQTRLDRFDTDPDWRGIPVLVFSDRIDEDVIAQSYAHLANAYVRKPSDRDEFVDVVRTIETCWIDTVWLPPRDGTSAEDR